MRMRTRTGKVARLPKSLRDQLGRRIEDGEEGKELVKWLNGLPEVQEILEKQFGGRPVTEQNLSEWKQGGYLEWLHQEELLSLVSKLAEQSEDLEEAADGQEISDRFASLMAVELTRLATALLEKETDSEKRWKRLCEVHRELSQLRRDDHRAVRTLIERQNWIRQSEREDRDEVKGREKEDSARRCAPFWAQLEVGPLAEAFGGGELGRDIAAHILEVQKGLPAGTLGGKSVVEQSTAPSVGPNASESDLIRPNQT
jgi:hypothetical protein